MRVALLQNFVAPYRVPLYEKLRDRVDALKVFVSTPMESDRSWKVEWGTLDVVVQKNITLRKRSRDGFGFTRMLQIHFPYDTIAQLWRYRPDAVISVELGPRSLQVVLYKMLRPSTRLLLWCKLSEHSERGWGRSRTLLRKFLLSRADGVLVNGESGARYIQSLGYPDSRIYRINQPVDVGLFESAVRQRPDGVATRMLCCGVLSERKGVLPFLTQLDLWAQANPSVPLELWWVGGGEMRAVLEGFACAPNLTQRFIGDIPYAELPSWYSQTDILVFPSLLDEWGLVVNEAMAAGLPVMGSIYAQAVTELVTEGTTGWVFDPNNTVSTQSVLDRVHQASPEQLAEMRRAVKRRIAQLTPQTTADKMRKALDAVMGEGKVSVGSTDAHQLAAVRNG